MNSITAWPCCRPGRRIETGGVVRGLLLCLLTTGAALGQTTATWIGGTGLWTEPSNWDGGVVPNNGGGMTYVAEIDVAGDVVVTLDTTITVTGLILDETLHVTTGGSLTVLNNAVNSGRIAAAGGTIHFSGADVANGSGAILAEGGVVRFTDTEVTGGTLGVTDHSASLVRFSGDVTCTDVPWEDAGAGEFQIHNTTARLLGDYAHQLPAGYTLVVSSAGTHSAVQWTLPAGTFTNNGLIVLRHGGGGWTGYPRLHWEGSGTLAGSGEVFLSGSGDNNLITGAEGVGLTIGPDQWVHGRGSIQVAVVNQGTLEGDVAGKGLTVTGAVLNHGAVNLVGGGSLTLGGGWSNPSGTVGLSGGGTLAVNGAVDTLSGVVAAEGCTLRLENAVVVMHGHALVADTGIVLIANTSISNGVLRATDNSASLVRFSGDVTLNDVSWEDPGAGEFQIHNTTARFLGDYAHRLPSGCTLVVSSAGTHSAVQWTLAGGAFTNDGWIVLRHGGGGWTGYPRLHWEGSGTLAGSGEVFLSGSGDNNLITGAEGVGLTIGPDQWVHGRGSIQVAVVNQGTLEGDVEGKGLTVTGAVLNHGAVNLAGGGSVTLAGGLSNPSGTAGLSGGGTLAVNGVVDTLSDLVAAEGCTLRLENAVVAPHGHALVADAGIVLIANTSISNGVLRATDHSASLVRFSGDIALTDVSWEDPGAGEFQIHNTTARFLGDYADQLPSGCTLVVDSAGTHSAVQWTLAGGVYTNDGWIVLRHGGGGWVGYPRLHWEGSGTLAGRGEVYLSGSGDNNLITGAEGVILTIGPDQWVHGRGSIQVDVVNQGILEADLAGKQLQVTGLLVNEGVAALVVGGNLTLAGGLSNPTGAVDLGGGGTLTVNGPVDTLSDLVATDGCTLRLANAVVDPEGHTLVADGGPLVIADTVISNGVLRATDHSASAVRFSGDITLTDVPWEDAGAGEFQIHNATARFLGDYAHQLPAGYTLVVDSAGTHSAVQWTFAGGSFTNDGQIVLRHGGGGWTGYPRLHWDGSGTLTGSGEVFLSGAGDQNLITGAENVILTLGPDQRIHGRGEFRLDVVNHGLLEADLSGKRIRFTQVVDNQGTLGVLAGATLVVEGDVANHGTLQAAGGTFDLNGSLQLGAGSRLATTDSGVIRLNRHLTGDVSDPDVFAASLAVILDGAGVPAPDLSPEAFFVEAEDFNYDRGLHEAAADVMPYLGGAYEGRSGRDRIDYHQTANAVSSDLYRSGEGPGVNVNIYALAQRFRGAYYADVNHMVGNNEPTEWFNYTRQYPATPVPSYLFARVAGPAGSDAMQVDEVLGNANTTSQTLSKLGQTGGGASGSWDVYTFVPVRDDAGDLVLFTWAGLHTLRATILDGGRPNLDYFVFAPAVSSGPDQLVEAMGRDLGPAAGGFFDNFAMGSLSLAAGGRVRLVDLSDNAPGATAEAVYLAKLTVPAGAILDLNSLHLYVQEMQVDGTIVNGTVQLVLPVDAVLEIQRASGQIEVSWPASLAGFALQSSADLAAWAPVPDVPAAVGERMVVTQPGADRTRAYRLHHD